MSKKEEAEKIIEKIPKGERTRRRILETALALFVERGYEGTTLRDIAAKAECSLGLTYRYFASKEDLVLALYQDLAATFAEEMQKLPEAPLAERFYAALMAKLRLVAPYRDPLGALFAAALSPRSEIAVLSDNAAEIRRQMREVFGKIVSGSTDAPPQDLISDLASLLYATHLALFLFWAHDRSQNSQATEEIFSMARDILAMGRPFLDLPMAGAAIARLAGTIRPVFG